MGWGGVIFRILFTLAVISLFFTIVLGITGQGPASKMTGNFMADYIDEKNGIQLYSEQDGAVKKEGFLNLGRFYRDILKVQGNQDVIENCKDSESFAACVDDAYENDPALQAKYNQQMKSIEEAMDIAEQHGIRYRDVPFIRDFMG